jgi:hypothetical protein
MRTAIEKGTSMKDTTGGTIMEDSSTPGSQFGFGIDGFLGSPSHGGSGDGGVILTSGGDKELSIVGTNASCKDAEVNGSCDRTTFQKDQMNYEEYHMLKSVPQQCVGCGTILLRHTNFCSRCGYKR